MLKYENYRKYFWLHLFIDFCLVLFTSGIVAFIVQISQKGNNQYFKYFPWPIALMLSYGLIRLLTLLLWAIKFLLKKKLGIGLVAICHFFILIFSIYWALMVAAIFSGMIGITPDGTEHRY